MLNRAKNKYLDLIGESTDPKRANRLCVSLSDIHLTDGSVGFQNLGHETLDAFYDAIAARCQRYSINEMTFVLDGDVVDMIRSDKWAKNEIYPWQRERTEDFSRIVNEIIHDIVDDKHKLFFKWLRDLPKKLETDAQVETVKIVITLGNHDKELFCDNKALTYFYEEGLGQKLEQISDKERRAIGHMYGDETMFTDKLIAPYLPFYYGDRGFRYFTTHGHWRDKENSRNIKAKGGLPSWSAQDGWQNEIWKKLKFSPFFEPCFGDTVAAGVLSTFIYKTKKSLLEYGYHDDRLMSILDELDLYRPTYNALIRIIEETHSMRVRNCDDKVIQIIDATLYLCVMNWLNWDFTYETSPLLRRIGFRIAKIILKLMKLIGFGLEIKAIAALMKFMNGFSKWNPFKTSGVSYKDMKGFPAFMPAYQHYGFQIHGEGHTHHPLQEEPNFNDHKLSTYINFGTWRDQIIGRKESGYRRRSVLRAFFILDLKDTTDGAKKDGRSFDYYTDDIVSWSDKSDSFSRAGKHQPHV